MAKSQLRESERKLSALVNQNQMLEEEVNKMETVLMMHQAQTYQEQNSVRGMLRQEIGGSIWEKGGEGHLTYKAPKNGLPPSSAQVRKKPVTENKETSKHSSDKNTLGKTYTLASTGGVHSRSGTPTRNTQISDKKDRPSSSTVKKGHPKQTFVIDKKSDTGKIHRSYSAERLSSSTQKGAQSEKDYQLGKYPQSENDFHSKMETEAERRTTELLRRNKNKTKTHIADKHSTQIHPANRRASSTDKTDKESTKLEDSHINPVKKIKASTTKTVTRSKVSSKSSSGGRKQDVNLVAFGEKLSDSVLSNRGGSSSGVKAKSVIDKCDEVSSKKDEDLQQNPDEVSDAVFTTDQDDTCSDPTKKPPKRVPSAKSQTQHKMAGKKKMDSGNRMGRCRSGSVDSLSGSEGKLKISQSSGPADVNRPGIGKLTSGTVTSKRPQSAGSGNKMTTNNALVTNQPKAGCAQADKEKMLRDLKAHRDMLHAKTQNKLKNLSAKSNKSCQSKRSKAPSSERETNVGEDAVVRTDLETQTPESLLRQLEDQVKILADKDPLHKETTMLMINRLQQQLSSMQQKLAQDSVQNDELTSTQQVGDKVQSQGEVSEKIDGAVDQREGSVKIDNTAKCPSQEVKFVPSDLQQGSTSIPNDPEKNTDQTNLSLGKPIIDMKTAQGLPTKSKNSAKPPRNNSSVNMLNVDRLESPAALRAAKSQTLNISMSKPELLKEVRKEREVYRKQIRHLESELKRIKHQDPLRNCELLAEDITFNRSDLIGEGGFSQVFRGFYQSSQVAIKQLKMALYEQDRNYFTAEVNLLHELRHPRVVMLLGVCTTEPRPLMILEYMSQGSLYSYLHDSSRPDLDHAAYFQTAEDVALGMNYLHRHRPTVLHLDLKSKNILLGAHGRAKIADFGFSKLRHDADTADEGKGQGVKGTPAWMAPEMLNAGSVSTKADIYSYAVILWEMLTRKHPYEGSSVFQILEKIRKNMRPEVPADCPKDLSDLIQQSWHPNPAVRPSFKDILGILENLAFPPQWRTLLATAGVAGQMLENVESKRAIIQLVTTTLDSEELNLYIQNNSSPETEDCQDEAGPQKGVTCVTADDTTHDAPENTLHDTLKFEYSDQTPHQNSGRLSKTLQNQLMLNLEDEEVGEAPQEDTLTIGEGDFLYSDDSRSAGRQHSPGWTEELRVAASTAELEKIVHDDNETGKGSNREKRRQLTSPPPQPPLVPPPAPPLPPSAPPPLEHLIKQIESGLSKTTSQKKKMSELKNQFHVTNSESGSKDRTPSSGGGGLHHIPASALLSQRQKLRPTVQPHPSQLRDLSDVGETQLNSLTQILRKAVEERRFMMGEDSMEHSVTDSGWSLTASS